MTALAAETHIAIPSSDRELPLVPLSVRANSYDASHLSPSSALTVPLAPTSQSDKTAALATLADAIDTSRTNLNHILTAWKDWLGNEDAAVSNTHGSTNEDDDEPEIEEEE